MATVLRVTLSPLAPKSFAETTIFEVGCVRAPTSWTQGSSGIVNPAAGSVARAKYNRDANKQTIFRKLISAVMND